MPSLTIKNIPEDLYDQLKSAADAHRRSINSEIIVCLETVLKPRRVSVKDRLSSARALRQKIDKTLIDPAELDDAKRAERS